MKQRILIGDILNLNVVGNDVAPQPGAECFVNVRLGINQKGLPGCTNENVGVHLALRIEHACLDGDCFAGLAQIICDLPVQKPKPVGPGDAKLCAR